MSNLGRAICGLLLYLYLPCAFAVELSLLVGGEHWNYKEFDADNVVLNTEKGALKQGEINLLVPISPSYYFYADFGYTWGALKYNGATQSGLLYQTQSDAQSMELTTAIRSYWNAYYVGAGVRYQNWNRDIRAFGNVNSLSEFYWWGGPLLTAGLFYHLNQNWQLGINADGALLSGKMKINLTEVTANNGEKHNFGSPSVELKNGYEITGTLFLKKKVSQKVHFVLKYQQGCRMFPKSNEVALMGGKTSIYEPKSKNYFLNYSMGIIYLF